jgi:membrane protease subunit HflK
MKELAERMMSKWDKYLAWFLGIIIILSLALGTVYTVDKDEQAIVKRFGAYHLTQSPGIHFKVPFADSVVRTTVTTVHRIEIGFRTVSDGGERGSYSTVSEEAEMLTADENIALVDFVVQYRSADPYKWQFTLVEPEKALTLMAQSAMRLVVGRSTFDQIATSGKAAVQMEAARVLQAYVDKLNMGVQIVNIQLQDVAPPIEVMPAFKDVVTAREEKDRAINDAQKYANRVVPEARGQAAEILNAATSYAATRVKAAEGDVARFTEVLAKYLAAPAVTAERLVFETQERVFAGQHVVIDTSNGNLLKLFDLTNTTKAQ